MNAPRSTPPSRPGVGFESPGSRCIWMSAGVLSYFLCPREQDCEGCVLDGILSGRDPALLEGGPADEGEVVFAQPAPQPWLENLGVPLRLRRGLWYHRTHVWGRAHGPGRVRLGLDDLAARLLAGDEPWTLPEVGAAIAPRDGLARTRAGAVPVRVGAPLSGRVVARNDALRRHPRLVSWSPYDAGWLVELATSARLGPLAGFMREEDVVASWFGRELERLDACRPVGPGEAGDLGETLADGGVPRGSLCQLLGPEGLTAALRTFFPFGD